MEYTEITSLFGSDASAEEILSPPARQRASDRVFDVLAGAILRGVLEPGSALPTQRELGKRFAISPLVVRQAIHRLEDLGLVRVRQGSTTVVLDPAESADIRLVALEMKLTPQGEPEGIAVWEHSLTWVLPMLELAERRITPEQLARLEELVERTPEDASPKQAAAFERDYWHTIAEATRNRIHIRMMRWWHAVWRARAKNLRLDRHLQQRLSRYRELNRALANRGGAVATYLRGVAPLLDRVDRYRDEMTAGVQQADEA